MLEIRKIDQFNESQLRETATGYVSGEQYAVSQTETDDCVCLELRLEQLSSPFVKRWVWTPEDLEIYAQVVAGDGLSIGAFDGDRQIGIAISERRAWNRSLLVWEFHVQSDSRRQGVGRLMMDRLVETARTANLERIGCEVQNTNVNAIRFYRSQGFHVDGIDVSHYSAEVNEVAIFMKREVR